MADIQEIPVENAAEIENIQNNAAENENNAAENENIQAENENNAAAPKKRGRPKGALNKKKPAQPVPVQPPRLAPAQPVQSAQAYFSPPPIDPTAELLGMLRQGMARQREHRVAKYASWVQRF
jgi:hypothetical protein